MVILFILIQYGSHTGHFLKDNKMKQVLFIFNYLEYLSEYKRLASLNLSGNYQEVPHI